MIEKGRHLGIDRELRYCPLCRDNILIVGRKREIPAKISYLSQNSHACPRKFHAYAWDSCLLALEKIACLLVFENPMLIP